MNQTDDRHAISNQGNITLNQLVDKLRETAAQGRNPEVRWLELKPEEILFKQGDENDSMYLLVMGMMGVRLMQSDGSEVLLSKLAPVSMIGELAMISKQSRTATAFAIKNAGLIRLNRAYFNQLSNKEKSLLTDPEIAVKRWQRQQLATLLYNFFGNLDIVDLHRWQDQMDWLHLANGDVVFEQGSASDGMYFVMNGRVRFTRSVHGGIGEITGEICPGQPFGDFGLLTGGPRIATIQAVRSTDLVRITRPVFDEMVCKYPSVMVRMAQMNAKRDQATTKTKPIAPDSLTITLLPHRQSMDIWSFGNQLGEAFSRLGQPLAMNHERFKQLYGQALTTQTANTPAVISFLSQLEANNQYLLLVADSTDTAWTKLCISHADRILIVADPKEDPSPGLAERYLSHIKISLTTDLVLWHPKMTLTPSGTLAWLNARNVTAHHHVRKEDDAHMQRLARRMSGHAIGLVLSGGAARGFAHIGVQHAMEELKIPVDTIGSSSMGGVVGGLMGFCSSQEILKLCEKEFSNPKILFDYTLPFTSVMASKKVTQMMHRLFGDRQIEDLWISFFCTATNLSTAQLEIFQQGPLWRAVRSTLAIPGVFTPVMENGEILVDGGVLNNFPVQLTADFCKSEYIIGVHMGLQKEGKRDYEFDTSLSGWQILFRRLNPFRKAMHVPSLASLLMNTLEVNSLQSDLAQVSLTDLMINPNVKAFKSTDYDAFGPIAQIGYNAALEPLGEWKKKRLTFLNR